MVSGSSFYLGWYLVRTAESFISTWLFLTLIGILFLEFYCVIIIS